MRIILPLVLGLALAALILRHFLRTPASDLVRQLYMTGGIILMAAGVGLLFVRQFAVALPVGLAGFMLFRRHRAMGTAPGSGQTSSVRAAGLEMHLDHDTGEMDGRILAGRHEGRRLSELRLNELLEVGEDVRDDAESLRLLEGYLDRAHAGWRDDVQADQSARQRATPASGGMDTKEAYQILGLDPGASETEVRDAHRRLMKQVHPDRGGSAALAAKINETKDRILGKHR
jgi:DnaJ-like protein